jgi:hypothetical protein
MAKLTLEYIRKKIKGDPRFDQVIDTDEPGKAFVWVYSPWTWDYLDGNRHMEAFVISKDGWYDDVIDTVGHFNRAVKGITREKDQIITPNGSVLWVDKKEE